MKLLVVKEAQQVAPGDEIVSDGDWLSGVEAMKVLSVSLGADGLVWLETSGSQIRVGRLSLLCVLTEAGRET